LVREKGHEAAETGYRELDVSVRGHMGGKKVGVVKNTKSIKVAGRHPQH